jgi:Ca2+/Na+ antiporter
MSADRVSRLVLSLTFLVWVGYGVLAGFGRWSIAVAFGLIAASALIGFASRATTVKLMDWTLLAYFVLAAAATFVICTAGFQTYSSVIIWALYAAVAWISILLRKPFTLQYARETTPPDRQGRPVFMRSNMVISSVWGLASWPISPSSRWRSTRATIRFGPAPYCPYPPCSRRPSSPRGMCGSCAPERRAVSFPLWRAARYCDVMRRVASCRGSRTARGATAGSRPRVRPPARPRQAPADRCAVPLRATPR